MNTVKILFLAANAEGMPVLESDVELREIRARIKASTYAHAIELDARGAVRPGDLQQALLETRPHVVHFSAHGKETQELMLQDDQGKATLVTPEALLRLFQTLRGNIRLVVFNACHSLALAETLSQVVDCAIGMDGELGEQAALAFSGAFFEGLAFGCSVREAFDLGRGALLLAGIPEEEKPRLFVLEGVDASSVVLVDSKSAGGGGVARTPSFTPAKSATMDRATLLQALGDLCPSDLEFLIAGIDGASQSVGHRGSVREQAAALVVWATSGKGCGLAALQEALANFP